MQDLKKYYASIVSIGGIIIFISLIFLVYLNYANPEWAELPYSLLKIGMFLLMWWLFDKFILEQYDTLDELFKKKNVAFAIVFAAIILSWAIIIG